MSTATTTRKVYTVDTAEVERAIRLLIPAGQVVEVRAPKAASAQDRRTHVIAGYFDDPAALARALTYITTAEGIYCTLNEFDPAHLAKAHNRLIDRPASTIADAHITRRRWLPIDLDPERTVKSVSATDAEHTLALDRARRIADALQAEGWPAPIQMDSGNGAWLLWAIDLPADDGGLVQRCLQALAQRFDDALVKVDLSVYNPARIGKIPGTWARKGDCVPDRPHRQARLLMAPDQVQTVRREQLEALARAYTPEPQPTRRSSGQRAASDFDLEKWIDAHLPGAKGPRDWTTQAGQGRKWLIDCIANGDHTGGSAWVGELGNGAITAGCQHQSCTWTWDDLRAKFEPGHRERAAQPSRNGGSGATPNASSSDEPPPWVGGDDLLDAPPSPATRPVAEIIAELEALRPADGGKPELRTVRSQIENLALDLAPECAGLSKADLQRITIALAGLGLPQANIRNWLASVNDAKKRTRANGGDPPDVVPYEADDGHIYKISIQHTEAGPQQQRTVVADFTALITEEVTTEDGHRYYVIAGQTADGLPYQVEIAADKFTDDGALLAALDEAAGAYAPVRAKMTAHLRPAIKLLTRQAGQTHQSRRYNRTGWAAGVFLIPGRTPADVSLDLEPKLAYDLPAHADLTRGLAALDQLLQALDPQSTTVAITAVLQPPLARPAGWQNERYNSFIAGRTGSLKTSWLQAAMSVYGPDFINDNRLIKWGEGATRMSIMHYATQAADLPLLLDNFKPNVGDGNRGFTALVHNLTEGTDKDRMQRSRDALRGAKEINAWAIFTGEDVPAEDPATIARLLVIPFTWEASGDNAHLTTAQAAAADLPAVGRAWLDWLEGAEGQHIAQEAGRQLVAARAAWLRTIKTEEKDAANAARIASNLAINQLTFWALRQHPTIGPIVERYAAAHKCGLEAIAADMARRSKVAREALRFLKTISELLSTGRCTLETKGEPLSGTLAERRIGWIDKRDGTYYIVFDVARREVLKVLGNDGLGNLSDNTLHSQLKELGYIASHDQGRHLKRTRVVPNERAQYLLHLTADAIGAADDATEEAGDAAD